MRRLKASTQQAPGASVAALPAAPAACLASPTQRHWSEDYLGRGYEESGRCFGFFLAVQEERFGRRIPVEAIAEGFAAVREQRRVVGWVKVDQPRDGDAVMMAHRADPKHIGIWVSDVAGGSVLHCVRGAGSALHSAEALKIAEWRIISFYRPAGE